MADPNLSTAAPDPATIRYFADAEAFRRWLHSHHADAPALWVGYYKKATGRRSITWEESVDEALCYGWIDGIRRTVDSMSYAIRFTPRREKSTWSAVNVKRIAALIAAGRVHRTGIAAWEARDGAKTGIYSYEQREQAELDPHEEAQFRANVRAWEYFQGTTPSYRKTQIYRVVTAKQTKTRASRLAWLIECSAEGRRV
jgi:uncharacterized protein YdeI (YjbR/CyaY-like superfamily)